MHGIVGSFKLLAEKLKIPVIVEEHLKDGFPKLYKMCDKKGIITCGELGIKSKTGLVLPAGVFSRYEK